MKVYSVEINGLCYECAARVIGSAASVVVSEHHFELCNPCADLLLQKLAYRKEKDPDCASEGEEP